MFNTQILAGSSGQGGGVAQQSLKFNDDESQYLSWTPAASGNRRTFTLSVWVKRGNITASTIFSARVTSGVPATTFGFFNSTGNLNFQTNSSELTTNAIYRDPSSWYHIVLAVDTTQATSSNRAKLYVNGEQVTSFSSESYPAQNAETEINNSARTHMIGRNPNYRYFDGYMSDFYFIDGQALDPTSFGKFTNGYWEKKDYAGSYGTNGFHLTFADDVVSEGFNAVTYTGTGATQSVSGLGLSADLVWVKTRSAASQHVLTDSVRGVSKQLFSSLTNAETTEAGKGVTSFDSDGFTLGTELSVTGSSNNSGVNYVAWAWDAGDVTSLVTNGDFSNGTTGWTANNCSASVNSDGRLAATYSSSGAYVYQLLTTVVGKTYAITYNNYQAADFVFVHATSPTGTQIASSNSSGTAPILFTATTTTTSIRFDIPNGQTRIIDNVQVFEANTDGTITSTVKANPDYGFSITSYTGTGSNATVGHGLGVQPSMIIAKRRDAIENWPAYHTSTGSSQYAYLDHTQAFSAATSVWQGVDPTSSVFSIGSSLTVNASGGSYIAYCFAEVAGYSKISSYSGTGAAGNAVTCGFRPAFVMIKRSNNTGNWVIWDTTRLPQSGTIQGSYLSANLSDAEESPSGSNDIEFTDTGFTLQDSGIYSNSSGDTFIYMAFADTREAAFWKDVSGQGNHWTPNNLDYRDSLPDSPANNFAVLNSVAPDTTGTTSHSFSEGNLKVSTSVNSWWNAFGTIGVPSGKYYWEYYALGSGTVDQNVGLVTYDWNRGGNGGIDTADAYSLYANSGGVGYLYTDGSNVNKGSGWFWTWGDVVNFAFDADTGKVWYGINGTWLGSGDPAAGTNEAQTVTSGDLAKGMLPAFSGYHTGGTPLVNFGQDSTFAGAKPMGAYTDDNDIGNFQYAPPAGYLALCTANLPMPTIIDGSQHFETIAWSGAGSTQQLPLNFTPDFVWAKRRNGADSHRLYDVIRGENQDLQSNSTSAELTNDYGLDFLGHNYLEVDSTKYFGASGNTFVGWNWKAGGTAVSNTDGSITSQVSANVDTGFSVVSWSGNTTAGATVGHGLGVAPDVIIFKRRDGVTDWHTYHSSISNGNTFLAYLNTTAVPASSGSFLNSTYPSSSVITLGNSAGTNGSSMIAYCFANTDTTKAGSYVANQSADGPFIYTGFRPAFFLAKNISRVQEWIMMDNKRTDPYNPQDGSIQPNSSSAEGTGNEVDFLSNGVKLRNSGGGLNYASGDTFIYLAFAENPFKYSNAR